MKATYLYRPWTPSTYPAEAATRAPHYLEAWLRQFPEATVVERDFEDWAENAAILHAAQAADLPLTVLTDSNDAMFISSAGWSVPQPRPGAPKGAMLGMWAQRDFMRGLPVDIDPVGSDERAVRATGDYGNSETFRRHAARAIAMTGADVEGDTGIEAGLRKVVDQAGHGRLFIKTVQKEMARRFDVDPAKPLWDQITAQDDGLVWLPVQHEGIKTGVLLVQEAIECRCEYRMFIIDGRPVTGSGCIEAFTPLDNLGETFDPQMEPVRNRSDVIVDRELRDRYVAFAEQFCKEFAAERGEGLDYSLDLCVDSSGTIRVIELNPPLNLGKYACDMHKWLGAIVDRTERVAS